MSTSPADASGLDTPKLVVELDHEADGRWIAEVASLLGVLAYGQTRDEAVARAEVLALRVLADRLERGEAVPDLKAFFDVA